ncbi:NADH:ubiquinone oxidoreductase, partial [Tulasnella sp. UAMH 9824]
MLAARRTLNTVARRPLSRSLPAGPSALSSSSSGSSRLFSTSRIARSIETPDALPKPPRWRRALTTFGRVTLVTVLGTGATFMYFATKETHPPSWQKPFDKDKKTVVILGSGWAATSMLKNMDTEDFNVHSCFLKELPDAEKLRERVMDCIESAAFPDQSEAEVDRLMHMIVVGGGPTGVEFSGELHDFIKDDLRSWYPELADKLKITLVEALPNVLPMFSRELIQYTESTFKEQNIEVLTKTMVKEVKDKTVVVKNDKGQIEELPYGLLVWAAGNVSRPITRDLMAQLPQHQTNRRGLLVDDYLRLLGVNDVYAIGDCTATSYAPTAQVATQQGRYLARLLGQLAKKEELEKRLAELRGERSGLPEGPEGKVKNNAEEIESVVKQLNR